MDYNARYYDPQIQQFISADTIIPELGNVMAWNRYKYVADNPINFNDQSGHWPNSIYTQDEIEEYEAIISDIRSVSKTDAVFLVNFYSSDLLPGESAYERTQFLLDYTYNGPYQHFNGEYGDSGFRESLKDGNDQVGHFLTGLRLGLAKQIYKDSPEVSYLIDSLVIGHEMISDDITNGFNLNGLDPDQLIQLLVGVVGFSKHIDFFNEDYENIIIAYDWIGFDNGYGNSLADCRLSQLAYDFAEYIFNDDISTDDAALWLRENLCEDMHCSL